MQSDASPFNPHNVLLQREDVESLFRRYGVSHLRIRDLNWYRKALTHRSYCTRKNENFLQGNRVCPPGCLPLQEDSNECLEYLGDAVLGAVVGAYLKERYPDENEGFLTRMRTKLVNGNMLADLCRASGLARFIVISRQIEEKGGRSSKNILEDAFEAFIGAVFEDAERDQQFNAARDWLEGFLERTVDFAELITQHASHKDALCKHFQHAFGCMPRFLDSAVEGGGGEEGACTVCVLSREGAVVGKATAPTKKLAENEASRKALIYFGQQT